MARIAENINTIVTDGSKVFAGVKDLAAAEIKPAIKAGAMGTGLFGATATAGLSALRYVLLTLALLFSYLFTVLFKFTYPVALIFGFGTMALLNLLVMAFFAILGARQFRKVKGPREAMAQMRESMLTLTNAATAGGADAKAGVRPEPLDDPGVAQAVAVGDVPPANYVTDPLR